MVILPTSSPPISMSKKTLGLAIKAAVAREKARVPALGAKAEADVKRAVDSIAVNFIVEDG